MQSLTILIIALNIWSGYQSNKDLTDVAPIVESFSWALNEAQCKYNYENDLDYTAACAAYCMQSRLWVTDLDSSESIGAESNFCHDTIEEYNAYAEK